MSEANVETARRGYEAIAGAYKTGDLQPLKRYFEETVAPECVLEAGVGQIFTEGEWHGPDGLLRFTANQMEALDRMWIRPLEFIEVAEHRLVVPIKFGGVARHTGIEVKASVVHVFTWRDGKTVRMQMFATKAEALEAAGLSE